MFLLILFLHFTGLSVSFASSSFFDPPQKYHEQFFLINPYISMTCWRPVCDNKYGCFAPVLFNRYVLSLPPIAGCPEVHRKRFIRFLALDRKKPDYLQSVGIIKKNSKVSFVIHGMIQEYDEFINIFMGWGSFRNYDYIIFVDWAYLALPYGVRNVPLGVLGAQLAATNTLLVGRVVCELAHTLFEEKQISFDNMRVIGFSAGADMLASIGDYCNQKYNNKFHHFVGIDLPQAPFRYSNYPLTNYTHAKMVDLVYSTVAQPRPIFEELQNYLLLFGGALEAKASCSYIINPNFILTGQPQCHGLYGCPHFSGPFIYGLADMSRCRFRYSQCPSKFSPSSRRSGVTQFNCYHHPQVFRTCINTTMTPYQTC